MLERDRRLRPADCPAQDAGHGPSLVRHSEQQALGAPVLSEHVTGDYRLWELVDNFTQLNAYTLIFATLMNLDKWNSLPPDVQKEMMSVCGVKGSMHIGKVNDWTGQETMEKLRKMSGKNIIMPSPEMVEAFRRAATPFIQETIDKLEARRLPAKAVYNELVELTKKYGK